MLRLAKSGQRFVASKRLIKQEETRGIRLSRQQFPLNTVRGFVSSHVPQRHEEEDIITPSRMPVQATENFDLLKRRRIVGDSSALFSTTTNDNDRTSFSSLSLQGLSISDIPLQNILLRSNANSPIGRNGSTLGTPSFGLHQKRGIFSRHYGRSALDPFKSQSLSVAWLSTGPSLKTKDEVQVVSVPPPSTTTAFAPRRRLDPIPSRSKLGKTRIPTPATRTGPDGPLEQLSNTSTKSMIRQVLDMTWSVVRMVGLFTLRLPGNFVYFLTHPTALRDRVKQVWGSIKHEANHYWVGTKLLWEEIKTAKNLSAKTLDGTALTRRERKQLLRTVSDLFRLIPFSMFILIPFMEFALPFALRLFPNMLPSTYQDSLKAEETMKRELKSRIAMAEFFQETLEELAQNQKKKASKREKELKEAGVDVTQEGDFTAHHDSASSMLEFLEKARNGEMIPSDVIFRYANYFQDDLTLDNMPRMQLINMCRYMGIQPYGSDSFLRFQLRHKIRTIKEDDGRILWEGIESLNKMELREACQERGMRSTGLSKEAYRRALKEWLDLSVNKDIPIALLIMSRTFFLKEDVFQAQADDSSTMSGLADAISGLDKEIVNEAILEVATTDEKRSDPEVRKIKLEVLSQQNELIREEEAAREAAAKKLRDEEEAAKKEQTTDVAIEGAAQGTAEQQLDTGELSIDTPEVKDIPTTEIIRPQQAASEQQPPTTASLADETPPKEDSKVEAANVGAESETTADRKTEEKAEEEGTLSPDEMDAISQLWTDDPVSKERADLERIKAAIQDELDDKSEEKEEPVSSGDTLTAQEIPAPLEAAPVLATEVIPPPDTVHDEGDKVAKDTIEKMDTKVAEEADAATTITIDDHLPTEEAAKDEEVDEVEDPIVTRLKKRVKSMVDKIEVQLTETQIKIGDKLHFLDKDKDGIFSMEEMAEALQTVLRRKISYEEAIEIASQMDANKNGLIVVDELIRWIDEHKLVEFVKEGRDADMDRIMESHASHAKQDDTTVAKPQ